MKQEKTKSKKRTIYYLVLAVCVLLLVAATVLTVYFVTGGKDEILDVPPTADDPNPPADEGEEPSGPSGGESIVRFIVPIEGEQRLVYEDLFVNTAVGGEGTQHKARDYHAEVGAAVVAMADGVVTDASTHPYLGNRVVIDHGDGIVTYYYYIDPASNIKVGDTVKQGQTIGTISEPHGYEENEGAHLHLEMVLNGTKVDPQEYIGLVYEEK